MSGHYYPLPGALSALAGPPRQVLLVTYDLKATTHNYNPFFDALKNQGEWWHYLTSTWLIATTKTPQELYNAVVSHIVNTDYLFVAPIKRPYWGYLPKEAWDWINARVPA